MLWEESSPIVVLREVCGSRSSLRPERQLMPAHTDACIVSESGFSNICRVWKVVPNASVLKLVVPNASVLKLEQRNCGTMRLSTLAS